MENSAKEQKYRFLIADDEPDVREALSAALSKQFPNALIYGAENGAVCLQKIRNDVPDLLILDLDMPKLSGVEVLENLKRTGQSLLRTRVIIITGLDTNASDVQFARSLGLSIVPKPFTLEYVIGVVQGLLESPSKPPKMPSLKLQPGELLFNEGDESSSVYLLRKGKLAVFQFRNGERKDIAQILQNELVGEIAFIDKQPRTASVEAIESSELVELPINDFDQYIEEQPIWMRTVFRTLINRLRASLS